MNEKHNPVSVAEITTRRKFIAGAVIVFGSQAAVPTVSAGAQQKTTEPQSTGTEGLLTYLHQEIEIQAALHRVYEALLDSQQFAAFTGMHAQISRDAGGAFTTFGGLIEGRNVELVPDRRIVQAWRPADWEPGVYSLVKFELKEKHSQTEVILDHTGFPEGSFRHLDSGWYLRYWEPLRKYLA
jgi:activator of HSP90 ATPase